MHLTEQAAECLARGDREGWAQKWDEFFCLNAMESLAKDDWRTAIMWVPIEPTKEPRSRILHAWAKAKPWMVIDGHYIQVEVDAWNKLTQSIIDWAKGEMEC